MTCCTKEFCVMKTINKKENYAMRTQKVTNFATLFLCIIMIAASVLTGCTAKETADTGNKPVVVYVADIFNTLNP